MAYQSGSAARFLCLPASSASAHADHQSQMQLSGCFFAVQYLSLPTYVKLQPVACLADDDWRLPPMVIKSHFACKNVKHFMVVASKWDAIRQGIEKGSHWFIFTESEIW